MDRAGSRHFVAVVVGRGLAARTSRRVATGGQHSWSNPSCDDCRRAGFGDILKEGRGGAGEDDGRTERDFSLGVGVSWVFCDPGL